MDNFNKIISFVLGLVVIVVFLAVITGRFKLRDRLPFLSKGATPTPTKVVTTPTRMPTITGVKPTGTYGGNTSYNKPNPSNIPATGAPTLLVPTLLSALAMGAYLRKKS